MCLRGLSYPHTVKFIYLCRLSSLESDSTMSLDQFTRYCKPFKIDLANALYPSPIFDGKSYPPIHSRLPLDNPIQQVFYNQAEQHRLTLDHFQDLVTQRVELHDKHIREIRHRHMEVQEALSITRMHKSQDPAKREANLERELLSLEENKRNEELALWKDTLELRTKAIEETRLYKAILGRARFLTGGSDDR